MHTVQLPKQPKRPCWNDAILSLHTHELPGAVNYRWTSNHSPEDQCGLTHRRRCFCSRYTDTVCSKEPKTPGADQGFTKWGSKAAVAAP